MAAIGASLGLAIAVGVYVFAGEEQGSQVAATVVDCSQTQLYKPENGNALLPASGRGDPVREQRERGRDFLGTG